MKISVIGSGNVATTLSVALSQFNTIDAVCSSTANHAQKLAQRVGAMAVAAVENMPVDSDLYLIMVSDNAVENVAAKLPQVRGVVAHTAGSINMNVLQRFDNHGVFYPMQSFTAGRQINTSTIPFCIEASSQMVEQQLVELAKQLSPTVMLMSSAQRAQCHLAAVFSSNFVNHMYAAAAHIMQNANLPFNMLRPLLVETLDKAFALGPDVAQTGPARRGDTVVTNRQREALPTADLQKMYSFVTESIMKKYGKL
ncbi:MAG: DUF2520 domain-containing protein [Salinivirgaceae bacterium]|nr:DUF2520 domain-containing protein [Salinivirgaceae bacterium]